MKEQSTPGPWFVNYAAHTDNGRLQIGSAKDYICEIYPYPDDESNGSENHIQKQANANLIAAAPDMYEALLAVYRDIELQNVKGGSDELNLLVQAALLKANLQ